MKMFQIFWVAHISFMALSQSLYHEKIPLGHVNIAPDVANEDLTAGTCGYSLATSRSIAEDVSYVSAPFLNCAYFTHTRYFVLSAGDDCHLEMDQLQSKCWFFSAGLKWMVGPPIVSPRSAGREGCRSYCKGSERPLSTVRFVS